MASEPKQPTDLSPASGIFAGFVVAALVVVAILIGYGWATLIIAGVDPTSLASISHATHIIGLLAAAAALSCLVTIVRLLHEIRHPPRP